MTASREVARFVCQTPSHVDHGCQRLVGGDHPAGPSPDVADGHRAKPSPTMTIASFHLRGHIQQHDVGHRAAAELQRLIKEEVESLTGSMIVDKVNIDVRQLIMPEEDDQDEPMRPDRAVGEGLNSGQ